MRIKKFRKKTARRFHKIDGASAEVIELFVRDTSMDIIRDCELDVTIKNVILTGSRCRGKEHPGSDIDVLVEYEGDMKEYVLFNILNGDEVLFGGVTIDINPVRKEETGPLEEYLEQVERYLRKKKK